MSFYRSFCLVVRQVFACCWFVGFYYARMPETDIDFPETEMVRRSMWWWCCCELRRGLGLLSTLLC